MPAIKTTYTCSNCGSKQLQWMGKCPVCGEWDTLEEEKELKVKSSKIIYGAQQEKPVAKKISEIDPAKTRRVKTQNNEFNRVLGGGIVPGSIILIGGEPGIGKSTLVLQILMQMENTQALYISGEESPEQIKYRANRLNKGTNNFYLLGDTGVRNIVDAIEKINPEILVVDSIQTLQTEELDSAPGTVSQIRQCTIMIQQIAKQRQIPVILIGHINKEGSLAGPKVLEHIVDVVLQFEGDRHHAYRILRANKNRYGATSELGIFEMENQGLTEIINPSEVLLSDNAESLSGTTIAASIEGIRPLMIEVQALVSSAAYGTPQRSSTGFDIRRLNMLLAVLEKRAGFRLSTKDVFLNITGGLKIIDPAIDLAVACSVLSSDLDEPIPKNMCFAGEIGLTGEIRPVNRLDQRISEAEKLGVDKIILATYNQKQISSLQKKHIQIICANKIEDVIKNVFGQH